VTFRVFKEDVGRLVGQAAIDAGYPPVEFDVSEPPQKEFGDLSCNVGFLLAKHAKKPPQKIAAELVDTIRTRIKGTYVLSESLSAATSTSKQIIRACRRQRLNRCSKIPTATATTTRDGVGTL